MLCPSFSYSQLCVCITSCRSPAFPKMVILTSSNKLAALFLKFVALEASTVKSFCAPNPLEKVRPLSCRVTPSGAGGGAFFSSRRATHFRSRYTPAVSIANRQATAADQRAYLAASLLLIFSVKQNFGMLYTKAAAPGVIPAPWRQWIRPDAATLYFWPWMPTRKWAGSRSSDNRGNCTWPGRFVCAGKFPHGCSCHDRTCTF